MNTPGSPFQINAPPRALIRIEVHDDHITARAVWPPGETRRSQPEISNAQLDTVEAMARVALATDQPRRTVNREKGHIEYRRS